jgi:HD-GYP domain-containing protein (c-di-GMP phosphodiesterase class II)
MSLERLRERLGVAGLPAQSLLFILVVIAVGWTGVGLCAVSGIPNWSLVAILAAAALVTEWLHVSADEDLPGSVGGQAFSFSSGVHIAAVVLVGPLPAAGVAVFGLVVADLVRGQSPIRIAFNSGVFAVASVAAGFVFVAAGGTVGEMDLPGDLGAAALLWLTYVSANTLLVSLLVSSLTRIPLVLLLDQKLRSEFASAAGEAGFGFSLAFFAEANGWGALFLVPLVFGVYQARMRLAQLRAETARSLETFANVIDERDPSTHRHSARVASHMRELAEFLELPQSAIVTLTWAGRLHDLGKISVDSSVLTKPGCLDGEEWEAMRRHPRLSAKLLHRFRFAPRYTSAVEYHHERFDGQGYYGLPPDSLPMEAFFIVVADSFDAMVSDRPYRRGMVEHEALAEIERGAGTQFHPLIARAFVAMKRGLDPKRVLSQDERAAIVAGLTMRKGRALLGIPLALHRAQSGILVGALAAFVAALATEQRLLVAAALVPLVATLARITADVVRGRALSRRIAGTLGASGDRRHPLHALRDTFATSAHPTWAAVVEWDARALRGTVVTSVGGDYDPDVERKIASWLLRDAEGGVDVLRSEAEEFGGFWLGLRLPDGGRSDRRESFAVFAFARPPAPWFERVLRSCLGEIGAHLAASPGLQSPPEIEPLRIIARIA